MNVSNYTRSGCWWLNSTYNRQPMKVLTGPNPISRQEMTITTDVEGRVWLEHTEIIERLGGGGGCSPSPSKLYKLLRISSSLSAKPSLIFNISLRDPGKVLPWRSFISLLSFRRNATEALFFYWRGSPKMRRWKQEKQNFSN